MSRGLGRLQRLAVLVLWRSDGCRAPVGELKLALGGDRGNRRRALRTLINRGLIEEVGEGNLIKLTAPAMYALVLAEHFGDLSDERVPSSPLDLDAILAGVSEDDPAWEPHANAVTPCEHELYPETRVSDNVGRPHGSLDTSWIRELSFDPPVRDNVASSAAQRIADALDNGKELER